MKDGWTSNAISYLFFFFISLCKEQFFGVAWL